MFNDSIHKTIEEIFTLPEDLESDEMKFRFPDEAKRAVGVSVRWIGNQEPELVQLAILQDRKERWPALDMEKLVPKEGDAYIIADPFGTPVKLDITKRDFKFQFTNRGTMPAGGVKAVISFLYEIED